MKRLCRVAAASGLVCALLVRPSQAVTVTHPEIIGSAPHDPEAFTQGLLLHEGAFFESTGLLGKSTLRQVEPDSGAVLRQIDLGADEFGEGIARVEDSIWMLTWKNQVAYRFALDDFSLGQSVSYAGEGWGLCFDGTRLVMSDGSSSLQFRDPTSFELLGRIDVTRDGLAVDEINELECALGYVYANVWHSDMLLQIDPADGNVVSQVDCSGLLSDQDAVGADVLNGIAYDARSGHFFVTGKRWPKVFELKFEASSLPVTDASAPSVGADGAVAAPPASQASASGIDSEPSGCAVRPVRAGHDGPFPFWPLLLLAASIRRKN